MNWRKCDDPVRITHYHLYCKTCMVELLSVVATGPGELLYMTVESETCDCCGSQTKEPWGLDDVRTFHEAHKGHELAERECLIGSSLSSTPSTPNPK